MEDQEPLENQPPTDEFANEDAVLAYTLGLRKKVTDSLLVEGKVPTCQDSVKLLLDNLSGMERVALGKKKIKADEGAANSQAAMAGVIAEALRKASSAGIGATYSEDDFKPPVGYVAPGLPADITPPDLVPGETDSVTIGGLDYNTFMAGFKED